MALIVDLRHDIQKYLRKRGLGKKWEKAKKFFENDPPNPVNPV